LATGFSGPKFEKQAPGGLLTTKVTIPDVPAPQDSAGILFG